MGAVGKVCRRIETLFLSCGKIHITTAPPAAVTLTCVPVTGAFSDTINTGLNSFWLHMKEKRDLCPTSELPSVPNHNAFTSHL